MAELKPWAELESLRAALREAEAQRDAILEAGSSTVWAQRDKALMQAQVVTERGQREALEAALRDTEEAVVLMWEHLVSKEHGEQDCGGCDSIFMEAGLCPASPRERLPARRALAESSEPRGGLNEKCPIHGNEHPAFLCPVGEPAVGETQEG